MNRGRTWGVVMLEGVQRMRSEGKKGEKEDMHSQNGGEMKTGKRGRNGVSVTGCGPEKTPAAWKVITVAKVMSHDLD